jgi:hypothetical protein
MVRPQFAGQDTARPRAACSENCLVNNQKGRMSDGRLFSPLNFKLWFVF